MPLFECETCGVVENTAPSNYWMRKPGAPALCSECDPATKRWHGLFPRKLAKDGGYIKNARGFLVKPEWT